MTTTKRRSVQLSVAAVAALAIFAAAAVMLLAGGLTIGSAQAQAPTGNEYPVPKPCGPGQDNFPSEPAEVVSSGHYALFDAYWQRAETLGDDDTNVPASGTLNNNLCPPAAKHAKTTNRSGQAIETTTLSPTNIDLRTTVIQVGDQHLADVAATNVAAGTTKLSLEKYKGVREVLGIRKGDPVPAGTKVHWLRLEDGDIPASDLVLGFSTGKLQVDYWDNPDGPTFEYELESVRVQGANPGDLPHVFAYWEPELGSGLVWDSSAVDTNVMPQGAGEYEHLEWVFTKPGTYVLSIHLKGHVRQNKPTGFVGTWERLTPEDEATSEVKQYVIQVGDLHINDQPHFGAVRSVTAGAAAGSHLGTPVGDGFPVFGVDADPLHFYLDGVGSDNFDVTQETSTSGHVARIRVAKDANLPDPTDPNKPKQAYYDLHLKVSDKHSYENNKDDEIDDILPVRVFVLPEGQPRVSLIISDEHPRAGEPATGETIRITAVISGVENGWYTGDIRLFEGVGDQMREWARSETRGNRIKHFRVQHSKPGIQRYSVVVDYNNDNPSLSKQIGSGWYPVVWRK